MDLLDEHDLRDDGKDRGLPTGPYDPPASPLSDAGDDPGVIPSTGTQRASQGATAPSTDAVSRQWLSRGAKGAASELIACAYLMARGFYVYRCESPHAPFDLVAYNRQRMLRVEVKSINDMKGCWAPSVSWPKNDEWDLIIAVGGDGRCIEIESHDRVTCTNIVRAAYGWPPVRPLYRSTDGPPR
jgi:hypothetical protein